MNRATRRSWMVLLVTASVAIVSGCRRNEDVKQAPAAQPAKAKAPASADQTAKPNASAPAASAPAAQPAPPPTPAEPAPPAAEEKPSVAITISKETTSITEPRAKNGYVDYLRALNQHFGKGVTPENNASALFWKAVGPIEIRPDDRQQYFALLGIQPLPEKGDYLADFGKYLTRGQDRSRKKYGKITGKTRGDTSAMLHPAMTRPWSKQEFAELATRLAASEKSLAMVIEASRRPKRYDPLFSEKEGILSVILLPALLQYHDATEALLRGPCCASAKESRPRPGTICWPATASPGWSARAPRWPTSSMRSIWTGWPVPATGPCCNRPSCRRPKRQKCVPTCRASPPCPSWSTGSTSASASSFSTALPWSPGKAFRRRTS